MEKEGKVSKSTKKNIKNKRYLPYGARVAICAVLFVVLLGSSLLCLSKFLNIEDEKKVSYQEKGNLDYKVYLKENEFYEEPYLPGGNGFLYVASLIDNIDIDFNYQFLIDTLEQLNFNYSIIGRLTITDQGESKTYYEKEYTLLDNQKANLSSANEYRINQNLKIDYAYYNRLANDYKLTFGVDGVSNLTLYLKIDKDVFDTNNTRVLNNMSQMSIKIPLSQLALDIKIDNKGINRTDEIVYKESISFNNVSYIVATIILFIASVASLLALLELLVVLFTKKSNYDKYIQKLLKEYDRLIVETPTFPDFEKDNIIKIERIEELLDARDNLKLPIMYHELTKHQKCYFYIRHNRTVYLLTIKAADLNVTKK